MKPIKKDLTLPVAQNRQHVFDNISTFYVSAESRSAHDKLQERKAVQSFSKGCTNASTTQAFVSPRKPECTFTQSRALKLFPYTTA